MRSWPGSIDTERLTVRPPIEDDRTRMVELWIDPGFMVYSGGAMTIEQANERFDRMVQRAANIPFAKQPIVDRATNAIVGYTGVDVQHFEGRSRMEWGYRLDEPARNQGYATEASLALMAAADALAGTPDHADSMSEWRRDPMLHAIIDPLNLASQNVIAKLGFRFWKRTTLDGDDVILYKRPLGPAATDTGRLDGSGPT